MSDIWKDSEHRHSLVQKQGYNTRLKVHKRARRNRLWDRDHHDTAALSAEEPIGETGFDIDSFDGSWSDMGSQLTADQRALIGREAERIRRQFNMERERRRSVQLPVPLADSFNECVVKEEPSRFELLNLDREVTNLLERRAQSSRTILPARSIAAMDRNDVEIYDEETREARTFAQDTDYGHYNDDKKQTNKSFDDLHENKMAPPSLTSGGDGGVSMYLQKLKYERCLEVAKGVLEADRKHAALKMEALMTEVHESKKITESFKAAHESQHQRMIELEEIICQMKEASDDTLMALEEERKTSRRLQEKIQDMEALDDEYRHALRCKEGELVKQEELKGDLVEKHDKTLKTIQLDHCAQLVELKQAAEKQRLQIHLEWSEKMEKFKLEAKEMIDGVEKKRQDELNEMTARLRNQEVKSREALEQQRREASEELENRVKRERLGAESELKGALQAQETRMGEESRIKLTRLQDHIDADEEQLKDCHQTISGLNKDLETLRARNSELFAEIKINERKLRAEMSETKMEELRIQKDHLDKYYQNELSKLKKEVEEMKECKSKMLERESLVAKQMDEEMAEHRHQQRRIVKKVNACCEILAHSGGFKARTVELTEHVREPETATDQLVKKALLNLKITCEELANRVNSQLRCLEQLSTLVQTTKKEKDAKLAEVMERMIKEKDRAVEFAKERLLEKHIAEISQLRDTIQKGHNGTTIQKGPLRQVESECSKEFSR